MHSTDPIALPQDPKNEEFDIICKLLLVGDSGVGKSVFWHRYIDDSFVESPYGIGVEFRLKTVIYKGIRVKLQLLDTKVSSQTRFFCYQLADGAVCGPLAPALSHKCPPVYSPQ